jgi:CDP-diacylglycerol---glycerol-3-phosphate 3-phosphatidyltransferase
MNRPPAPRFAFLAATSLTYLKPRFKLALQPVAAGVARRGVVANQVTVASLLGSLLVGATLVCGAGHSMVFALLPMWLLVRMGLAAIDGTLAIEFGQRSRLGGILNEAGDIVSDVVLIAPLAFASPALIPQVAIISALTIAIELTGLANFMLGGIRRVEGPFGKADRSIVLAAAGAWIACFGSLPAFAPVGFAICGGFAVLTIVNRVRFAVRDREQSQHGATHQPDYARKSSF